MLARNPSALSAALGVGSCLAFTAWIAGSGLEVIAWAQPTEPCTEAASIEMGLTQRADVPSAAPFAFPGFPVNFSGRAQIVISKCQKLSRKPVSKLAWRVEGPDGRALSLSNPTAAGIQFVPPRPGVYKVTLIACPDICRERLITGFTSTNKPINEVVELRESRTATLNVPDRAQLAPVLAPPPLPSAVQLNGELEPATQPGLGEFKQVRDRCAGIAGIAAGSAPQWLTMTNFQVGRPVYTLAEGRVYFTNVSRKDHPASHHSNDANTHIELDPPLRKLLVADTPEDKSTLLPLGGLEIEWEDREFPEPFRAIAGDRVSALGFHVIDCGHEKYTEIHPPIAMAIHRPRAVVLPEFVDALEAGKPGRQRLGTNVATLGIVTDIWVSFRGGQALDCGEAALHRPGGPCVPQPVANGTIFRFHVYLPINPATRVANANLPPIARPALFTAVENHPQAGSLGARTDLPLRVVRQRLDVNAPFLEVEVDLTSLATGERFAKRIRSAWIYPDVTGANFDLRALRARLKQLKVTKDGDPEGDGDWRFWASLPSIDRPWTRLIDCSGCVEEKTYTPGSSIFRSGALGADGTFGGELLLLKGQVLPLQFNGYDGDAVTSDDTGTVIEGIRGLGSLTEASVCNDQTVGGLNDLDPSASGCGAYSVTWEFVATPTPVRATLSPEGHEFAKRLMVRTGDRIALPDLIDAELYRNDVITPAKRALTDDRKGEVEAWQAALATNRLKAELQPAAAEELAAELRKHVMEELGPNPSPRQRQKVAAELRELKNALPPDGYRKHLCDLETGTACP